MKIKYRFVPIFVCSSILIALFPDSFAFAQLVPGSLSSQATPRPGMVQRGQRYSSPAPSNRTVRTERPQVGRAAFGNTVAAKGAWRCLLFAVDDYDVRTQGLSPLRGCYNDMAAARDQWLRQSGVSESNIVFLHDRTENHEMRPTRDNFNRNLDRMIQEAQSSDTLVVLVACHGIAAHSKSYLCPSDTRTTASNAGNSSLDVSGLISVSSIIDRMKRSKAKHKLLLLDACRNSRDEKSEAADDFMKEFETISRSLFSEKASSTSFPAVITSCSIGQEAHEINVDGVSRGVFMKFFLDGLDGPADYMGVIDGNVTLSEAYAYAFSQTSKYVFLCRNRRQQTPEIFREGDLSRFFLSQTEPTRKRPDETDMQFLLRQSMKLATHGSHETASKVLSHIIDKEPNNNIAYACRGGVFLSRADYRQAMDDMQRLGRTLDLYACLSEKDKSSVQEQLNRMARQRQSVSAQQKYAEKNLRILLRSQNDNRAAAVKFQVSGSNAPVRDHLVPGQKVSISAIDGDWFYVARVDDNPRQNGIGWVHADNLTWTPDAIENYRPETVIHTPRNPSPAKIGGLSFRQSSGAAGGGTGRSTMQRMPGMGGI